MSSFTDEEKVIIGKLLEYKQDNKMQELECFNLLRKSLETEWITWEKEARKSIQIAVSSSTDEAKSKYVEMIDFLHFIERLVREQYVVCLPISVSEKCINEVEGATMRNAIYDETKYDKDDLQNKVAWGWLEADNGSLYRVEIYPITFYIDVIDLIEKFEKTIIYPLPSLTKLSERKFYSPDDFRLKQQLDDNQKKHDDQMKRAWCAILLPAIVALLSLFIQIFTNTNYSNDLKAIKEAIHKDKSEMLQRDIEFDCDSLQMSNRSNQKNDSLGYIQ